MKILIVDDEAAVADFFGRMATLRGFDQVDTAECAQDAVSRVLQTTYDLITLDVRMPGTSGLDVIAMLRNMNPHAVIAVISGFIPDQIPAEALSCIDVLLPKPVNVQTFQALLDGACQLSRTMDHIRLLGAPAVAAV